MRSGRTRHPAAYVHPNPLCGKGYEIVSSNNAKEGFFGAHKKKIVGILVVLALSLGAGGAFFHVYSSGPDYAFKSLKSALRDDDKAKIATIMDFRSLSEDLIHAVLAVYPKSAANETQAAELRDEAQRQAFKALSAGKASKQEAVPPRKLFEPVPFVTEDLIPQLAAGMQLEKSKGVQILTKFNHSGLQTVFPLRLLMERRQDKWRVTRLLNAMELVGLYKGAMDVILAADEAKLAEKNEKITAKMRAHFDSPKCIASMNRMGGKHEAMLVVKVTAVNKEPATLHNVNLLCEVRASNGTPVYSRQLSVVQRVFGGDAFSNTWTIALDADSEEAARLLQAGPLSCSVEPKVMSVGVGEVLYPRKD
jgi:hypothetical protein